MFRQMEIGEKGSADAVRLRVQLHCERCARRPIALKAMIFRGAREAQLREQLRSQVQPGNEAASLCVGCIVTALADRLPGGPLTLSIDSFLVCGEKEPPGDAAKVYATHRQEVLGRQ